MRGWRETRCAFTSDTWVAAHIPPGAKVAAESYTPYLAPDRYEARYSKFLIQKTADWYIKRGYRYAIAGPDAYGRFMNAPRYADQRAQYEALFARFELLEEFGPGPHPVRIYRIPKL